MALSKSNVAKARNILIEVERIQDHDEVNPYRTGCIIGFGKKTDGGWENVYINVKDITPGQLRIFESRKEEIGNSSFCDKKEGDITRIGWY